MTREQAIELAERVREAVIAAKGSTVNQCIFCSQIIRALYPDAIELDGTIPGDWEYGGEHTIVMLRGWMIDAASEQFGLGRVMVCADDEYPDQYDNFARCWQSGVGSGAEKIAASIAA